MFNLDNGFLSDYVPAEEDDEVSLSCQCFLRRSVLWHPPNLFHASAVSAYSQEGHEIGGCEPNDDEDYTPGTIAQGVKLTASDKKANADKLKADKLKEKEDEKKRV